MDHSLYHAACDAACNNRGWSGTPTAARNSCIRLIALIYLVFGCAHGASAAVTIPAVLSDTPTVFEAYVDQVGPIPVTVVTSPFASGNWVVGIEEDDFDGGGTPNDLRVVIRHKIAPHAGEAALTGLLPVTFFNVTPGGASVPTVSASAPHTGHTDVLQVSYDFRAAGISQISISIHHVSTLGGAPGLAMLPRSVFGVPFISVDNIGRFSGRIRHLGPVTGGPAPWPVRVASNEWEIFIEPGNYDAGTLNNDIRVNARHLVAPHNGENAPNPGAGFFNVVLNNVVPGGATVGPSLVSTPHIGPPGHVDSLSASYQRFGSVGTAESDVIFDAMHPLPREIPMLARDRLLLLVLALALLAWLAMRWRALA